MAVLDHGVHQVLEHVVRLLVSGHAAHRHDERVTCRDRKPKPVSFALFGLPAAERDDSGCEEDQQIRQEAAALWGINEQK